jgi:hypothetical protein
VIRRAAMKRTWITLVAIAGVAGCGAKAAPPTATTTAPPAVTAAGDDRDDDDAVDEAATGEDHGHHHHADDADAPPQVEPPPAPRDAAQAKADLLPVHLSDASGSRARRAGQLPDLRHGARAAHDHVDEAPDPELRRHDAAALDRGGAARCRCVLVMADMLPGPLGAAPVARSALVVELALATPVCGLGGVAVLRARGRLGAVTAASTCSR